MGTAFATAFITLVVLMDPLGNIPTFLALSSGQSAKQRARSATSAVLVALIIILGFALAGRAVLDYLNVSIAALSVAGGLLLALIALEMLRGHYDDPDVAERGNIALVPLGTPLIAGPGAIAATMVLLERFDGARQIVGVALAIAAALAVVWIILRLSAQIGAKVSDSVIHLLSRVMGLLLAGIAVELVFTGTRDWITTFG